MITLEDVLEEVIKSEIVDETDNFISNDHRQVIKRDQHRPVESEFLRLFGHKLQTSCKLSEQEIDAVAVYLQATMKEFSILSVNVVKDLLRKGEVCTLLDMIE